MKSPATVGAITPSSRELAREITRQAHVSESYAIAELGSGTGIFTKEILQAMPPNGKLLAIERNPSLVDILRRELIAYAKHCPEQQRDRFLNPPVFCDDAAHLPELMQANGLNHLDTIVSGLPWAIFSDELQDTLLQVIIKTLKPNGYFTTFAYIHGLLLPAGQHFSHKLTAHFATVTKSRIIWGNIPPAFVYVCTTKDTATS